MTPPRVLAGIQVRDLYSLEMQLYPRHRDMPIGGVFVDRMGMGLDVPDPGSAIGSMVSLDQWVIT